VNPLNVSTALAHHSGLVSRLVSRGLQHPRLGRFLLHHVVPPGERQLALQSILANTVNPTIIQAGGGAINVVPAEVIIHVDGRVVPGSSAAELVAEYAH